MYRRIASRRGAKVATVAVARTILEICYFMIRDGTHFNDLGADYFTERNRDEIKKRSIKRLESLGYSVTVAETG
jgi:hypothetical protein